MVFVTGHAIAVPLDSFRELGRNEICCKQIGSAVAGIYKASKDEADDKKKKKNDDLVVTPGGPRPADQVHSVGPGQILRRNPDGSFSVVPDETPGSAKEPTPK